MRKLAMLRSVALAAVFSLLFSAVQGQQVTVMASQETGDPDEVVKVEVKVADFDAMVSSQFSLLYDTLIVEYAGIGDFGIFNINSQNFGVPEGPFPSPKGIITFLWIADNIITGQTLADSTVLFSISFKITGTAGQTTPIHFSDEPTDLEFGNTGGEIPYTVFDGAVTVAGGSAVEEIKTRDFTFLPIVPNPVQDDAIIRFSLRKSSQVSLRISDQGGMTVYQLSDFFGSGLQTVSVKKNIFPVSGTYFATITTGNAQAVQKLAVIR